MDSLYYNRSYRSDAILIFVFVAMLADYIISYLGISVLGFIQEANPFMLSFMDLPFYQGIFFRVLYAVFFLLIIRWAGNKMNNKGRYHKVLILLLAIQSIPLSAHAIWLVNYLSMQPH
ncbi:MAG: DUF5658 family protein [Bacillota bacterium]